jgi:hypothetical protein
VQHQQTTTKTEMVDIFFIIIVVIGIGLFGGLLYLIYIPFKNRLKKSGKLTDKLNRQINRTFIISLCLVGVVLYCFKDCRTSSKDRLEKISNIKLPKDFRVLKDEYQDMWQDYCILYDIQLDNNATTELIKNIKTSKFYNKNSFHNGAWIESDFVAVESVKAVWCKSPTGFDFSRQDGLTSYHIEFDTLTNILKYNECAD